MSKSLCCLAFEALYNRLHPNLDAIPLSSYLKKLNETLDNLPKRSPLFITWNKNHDLRGCIGTFQSLPIESGIRRYAINAAMNDSRFASINKSDFSQLEVSITLLDNFTQIYDCYDWEIGKHGLELSFQFNNSHFSGTFLPIVAEEQQWDHVTTLYYLLRKSDFNHKIHKDKVVEFFNKGIREGWLELIRYNGLKYSLDHHEFMKIRESF